jgi:hypothetical protein
MTANIVLAMVSIYVVATMAKAAMDVVVAENREDVSNAEEF